MVNHLNFIRSLKCVNCGTHENIQAAHLRLQTNGGMGKKPSDRYTTPLCHDCHAEQHRVGEKTFWGDRDVKKLCNDLWAVSGDRLEGFKIINKFMR